MVSTLCPYCATHSHVTPRWGCITESDSFLRVAATCDNCQGLVVGEGYGQSLTNGFGNDGTQDPSHVRRAVEVVGRRLTWRPTAAEAPVIEDVPDGIARAAKEAHTSLSIGNYMAAILMARTVIEATAKASDITTGSLASKINAMSDQQLIRPALARQAHAIRYVGNDMAHGDIDQIPEQVDAEEVLVLMGQVLSEVFQHDAIMNRVMGRRS